MTQHINLHAPRLVPALLLAGTLLAPGPALATLAGVYELAGTVQSAQARIHASIEAAISELGLLSRAVARKRLRDKNQAHRQVELRAQGDNIQVRYDDFRWSGKLDKPARVTLPGGEQVTARARRAGEAVVVLWTSEDGTRQDTFRETDTGLQLRVLVQSDRLPRPVHYELRYRRR